MSDEPELQNPAGAAAPRPSATQAEWKQAAARAAVAGIPEGAVVGLGSGTTAEVMLAELATRVQAGLRVVGVPTSERTRTVAASLGIPLAEFDDVGTLTLSIDGADEVTLPWLDLIKGRGGALLREKLVASASAYRIIIVDDSKLVPALATTQPVPVEVAPFGWRHTAGRLVALGAQPILRLATAAPDAPARGTAAAPYLTDGGHYILDCRFASITQPEALRQLAYQIKATPGVVEHGLFIAMTDRVIAAGSGGIRTYDRPHP